MITKEQATALQYRTELYHRTATNADGTPLRCRVNGKTQTWKTRPTHFRIPVKHGLRNCFYITQDNAHEWDIS
jgi:hypothetical protein